MVQRAIERALVDTNFLGREFLGYDYWQIEDEDEEGNKKRTIVRPGGLVDAGPFREMQQFGDGPGLAKMIMACRGSLKTTYGTARLVRNILADRNIRQFVGMETFANAAHTVKTVRDIFKFNERLKIAFGEIPITESGKGHFTVGGREASLRGPTLQGFGLEKVITGGHGTFLWWDDPTSWQQAMSGEQLEKTRECLRQLIPILDPGAEILVTLTPYAHGDVSFMIREELAGEFRVLILPCGMVAERNERGEDVLVGTPTWPHLDEQRLKRMLAVMKAPTFNAQMALILTNPGDQLFTPSMFRSEKWDIDTMFDMGAYQLTDTAVTDNESACFSVCAIVLLDWDDTAFLADLRVGHWHPNQFRDQMLNQLDVWGRRCRIQGSCFERTTLNKVYRAQIEDEARRRRIEVNFIDIPRGGGERSKNERIRGLQQRLSSGKLRVLDSVPRYYVDLGKEHLLWNPNPGGEPEGELVRQFVNFRMSGAQSGAKDIPDALADLDQVDQEGIRYCHPSHRPRLLGSEMRAFLKNRRKPKSSAVGGPSIWSKLGRRAR